MFPTARFNPFVFTRVWLWFYESEYDSMQASAYALYIRRKQAHNGT